MYHSDLILTIAYFFSIANTKSILSVLRKNEMISIRTDMFKDFTKFSGIVLFKIFFLFYLYIFNYL